MPPCTGQRPRCWTRGCGETCATTGSGGAGAPADGSGSRCERSRRSQAHAAHQRCGRRPTADAQWRCGRSAVAALRESGIVRSGDDSSSASRRAKQNDASAPPCPARPSRACLASRTNHVPAVTRVGGRGDGAAVDDGPLCRRRADAAAPSARGRDLGGRGPMRRVLRQADGGRAQTSLSWLADTLLSQDRAAPIRFCRPTTICFLSSQEERTLIPLSLLPSASRRFTVDGRSFRSRLIFPASLPSKAPGRRAHRCGAWRRGR